MKFGLIRRSDSYHPKHDYYSYLWFRYHRLFIGSLIRRGKKLWAFNFMCDLRYNLKLLEKVDPFWVFLSAMTRITPSIILYPLKLSGTVYGVPMAMHEKKRYTYAVKWVTKAIRDKDRILTVPTVSDALVSAVYGRGISIEKLEAVNRTTFTNQYLMRLVR